jgi:hypothetical protein
MDCWGWNGWYFSAIGIHLVFILSHELQWVKDEKKRVSLVPHGKTGLTPPKSNADIEKRGIG